MLQLVRLSLLPKYTKCSQALSAIVVVVIACPSVVLSQLFPYSLALLQSARSLASHSFALYSRAARTATNTRSEYEMENKTKRDFFIHVV